MYSTYVCIYVCTVCMYKYIIIYTYNYFRKMLYILL